MKKFEYRIKDPIGIHARPAGLLVKEASKFSSAIFLEKEGKSADAKKIMGIMGLGVKQDMTVTIIIEGEDEELAASALEQFFQSTL